MWEKKIILSMGPINAGKIGTNTENIQALQMRSESANQEWEKTFYLVNRSDKCSNICQKY